jgi:hypothetical protein
MNVLKKKDRPQNKKLSQIKIFNEKKVTKQSCRTGYHPRIFFLAI